MKYRYQTVGTCSQQIDFEIDDNNILHNVQFYGGCNGNLKGIGRLVEGMPVADVISKLEGTTCGMKTTSCPDQLTVALKKVMKKRNATN
ncbi:MAG: TIGR03905 family TSCPD domain-containing protein [Salinivirgaceae bacterium]|nr:TIGR03905 family TSCPD domain-containing protein [Salinivirgaceae bacterium]MBR4620957.1 TIGR03905 family TSCPD domain-containing protein [Salinivirgaceae bacterium]